MNEETETATIPNSPTMDYIRLASRWMLFLPPLFFGANALSPILRPFCLVLFFIVNLVLLLRFATGVSLAHSFREVCLLIFAIILAICAFYVSIVYDANSFSINRQLLHSFGISVLFSISLIVICAGVFFPKQK